MDSLNVEGSSPFAWNAVINELTKGRDSVARLASLLLVDPTEENYWPESSTAKLLVEEILEAISRATAALESGKDQGQAVAHDSPSLEKTSSSPAEKRKLQGKRRSTNRNRGRPYSWTRVASLTIEDGHIWRKYGQKEIFSAKHPRSYYRCAHKYDRGCMATRQVQKSEEDPSIYIITYFGEHKCDDAAKDMFACRDDPGSISFQSNMINGFLHEITLPSSFPLQKHESEEEVLSNVTCSDSLSDYYISQDTEFNKAVLEQSATGFVSHQSISSPGFLSGISSYDLDLLDLKGALDFDPCELLL